MKTYSCKVRLGGSVMHEVPKDEVTAAEVTILRYIHGDDAVLEIKPVGDIDRSDVAELDRLRETYGQTGDGDVISPRKDIVSKLFGIGATAALPKALPGIELPTEKEPPKINRRASSLTE